MLTMYTSLCAADAQKYFSESLEPGDYYLGKQERAGLWQGKLAERFGLSGEVSKDAFYRLCDNQHPASGERLTQRQRKRIFEDLTFAVPKSVSLLWAHTRDERIIDTFLDSVRETMRRDVEPDMEVRVRKGKAVKGFASRTTGNGIWGEFLHLTARPVNGHPDPHLHCHCPVFSVSWDAQYKNRDGTTGALMAMETMRVHQKRSYYQARCFARLAAGLRDLGYEITPTEKSFEITGIERGLIDKFSRRTIEIEAKAEELGIVSASAKATLAAKTRGRKANFLGLDELHRIWRSRLSDKEHTALERAASGEVAIAPSPSPDEIKSLAIESAFANDSVLHAWELEREFLRLGVGSVHPDKGESVLTHPGVLRKSAGGKQLVTTETVLDEETEVMKFASRSRGSYLPLCPKQFTPEQFSEDADLVLNRGQSDAVKHIWRSKDRVILIAGGAGCGKTTSLRIGVKGLNAVGISPLICAPTTAATGNLINEGFATATTLQRLLLDTNLQPWMRNNVVMVDEAGMMGMSEMRQLFQLAQRWGSRVLLVGDDRQHNSVSRGDAFRLLQTKAGLKPAVIRKVMRQKITGYREAVESLASAGANGKKIGDGLDRLHDLGFVRESPSEGRFQALASCYLDSIQLKGRNGRASTALVVSPTHAEGAKVTEAIRTSLKEQGTLSGREHPVEQLINTRWNTAERKQPHFYANGMVVQFHQHAKGFSSGERVTVQEQTTDGRLLVERGSGSLALLDPALAERYQVFTPSVQPLARGDRIRITHNGRTPDGFRLNNGDYFSVKGFTKKGDPILQNGRVLPKDSGHWAHGYCVTSHASQSRTVDHVIISQSRESFPASSVQQMYVSASRGKYALTLFTDDFDQLKQAAAKSHSRPGATEAFDAKLDSPTPWQKRVGQMRLNLLFGMQERIRHLQQHAYAFRSIITSGGRGYGRT